MDKRWKLLEETISELSLMERMNGVSLAPFRDRLARLKLLEGKVVEDEALLKEQILTIVHERNVYAEKINEIWELGESRGWADERGLLKKVRSEIEQKNDLLKKEL